MSRDPVLRLKKKWDHRGGEVEMATLEEDEGGVGDKGGADRIVFFLSATQG